MGSPRVSAVFPDIGDPHLWGERQPYQARMSVVVSVAHTAGIGFDCMLRGTSLTEDDLTADRMTISVRDRWQVLYNIATTSTEPALGALAGRAIHVSRYGMFGYAVLSASTVRDAWDLMDRYWPTVSPLIAVKRWVDAPYVIWEAGDVLPPHTDALWAPELDAFAAELALATLVTVSQDMAGAELVPLSLDLMRPEAEGSPRFVDIFGCPVHWGQTGNRLRFPVSVLDVRPHLSNPEFVKEVSQSLERLLSSRVASVAGTVAAELTRQPGHFPTIEVIAERLHMTSRTLRRKLTVEGTNYRRILSQVRFALATDYLNQGVLRLEDIAERLGYSEVSSLTGAYRRWRAAEK